MFGRQPVRDSDVGAAARRRLAALAAQYPPADLSGSHVQTTDADHAESVGLEGDSSSADSFVSESAPMQPRHLAAPSPARARWEIDPYHLALVAVAVCAVLVVSAWLVLRSAPESEVVPASVDRTVPATVAAATPTSPVTAVPGSGSPSGPPPVGTPPATASLVVDVAGKVRSPGIVELPSGSRVVDALQAAGGTRAGVDTRALNLARLLVDGEQIVVGYDVPGASPATSGAVSTSAPDAGIAPVNLNTATAEQLDTLPGIGPVTAQAILSWREENGGFTSVDELLDVSGIGDATLADIEAYVFV